MILAEEDAAEPPDSDGPGEWALSEEDVRREQEESLVRMDLAKAHIRAQEGVMSRISAKLTETGDSDALAPGSQLAAGSAARPGSPGPGSSWSSPMLEGAGSREQRQGARVVSEEMLRRQDRWAKFNRRRREVLEQNRLSREKIATELEAADARCVQRQRERLEESHRRAFAAQQRRSEQQKVFRENQREQERMWEAYYLKLHPSSKSSSRLERPLSKQSDSARVRATSAPGLEPASAMEEDIFRSTCRSHATYASTMERWRQFEAENERRTEAYKRKLLGTSSGRAGAEDEPERAKGDKGKQRPYKKDGQRSRTFVRQGHTSETVISMASEHPAQQDAKRTASPSVASSPNRSIKGELSGSATLPALSTWESRMAMCHKHAEDKFQRGQEKIQRNQEAVKEARQRIDSKNKERAGRAGELNETWRERNDTAAFKRAELEFRSDEELLCRQADLERKHSEEMRRRDTDRFEQSQARANLLKEAKNTAQSLWERTAEKFRMKQLEKESLCQQNLMAKYQDFESKAHSQLHAELAREKAQRKRDIDEEFREKARQETELKHTKSQGVLTKKRQAPLELQRTLRKEKSATGMHSTLRLGDTLGSSLGSLGGTAALGSTLNLTQLGSIHSQDGRPSSSAVTLPAVHGAEGAGDGAAAGQPLDGTWADELSKRSTARYGQDPSVADVLSLELQGPPAAAAAAPPQLLAPPPAPEGSAGGSGGPASAMDSDDEGAFLKELETRSVKWLHDMRRQKKSWKP